MAHLGPRGGKLDQRGRIVLERVYRPRLRGAHALGDVRLRGLMGGIELIQDKESATPYDWTDAMGARVCRACRPKGVLLRPLGPVIVLMPPLSITLEQIEQLMDAVAASIDEVTLPS